MTIGADSWRITHPSAALAAQARYAVRPKLKPFVAVSPPRPAQVPAAAPVPPIGEFYNGGPTDVMLQGFHYTSYQSANPNWYVIVAQNAAVIRAAGIDLVWLPPPSDSVSQLGYLPRQWNTFDTSYGSNAELGAAIAALAPLRAIGDVVVNHRCGVATAYADFGGPPFAMADQTNAICANDECACGTGALDTGENQIAARDLDHTNGIVQAAIATYLTDLGALGFGGWRYDEARGYGGGFVQLYNDGSDPYLSVGEYWDADRQNVMNWIDATRGRSMAFDFPTRTLLKAALDNRQFSLLKTIDGKPTGAIGWWPAMSVTFIENHDTDKDSAHPDEFGDGDQVLHGYAYLFTHPGIPCVFWPHMFDYGPDIASKIRALVQIRKAQGLTRTSVVNIVAADDNAKYAAIIDDTVAVKLGPGPWDPGAGWNVATDGNDYAVWTR